MLVLGSKLRVLLRRFRYRQQIKKSVDMNCRRSECGLAGRILFKHSSILETQRQIIRQSVIRESVHASDLQRIFNTYCSYGQRGNTTRLGVGNFARLIKETPCVMQPTNPTGLSQSDVELTFMKYRGRSKQLTVESHLHYNEFLKALRALASIFLPPQLSCRQRLGSDAQLCIFLQKHVFQSKVAINCTEELRDLSCRGRAQARLNYSAQTILQLWRGHKARLVSGAHRKVQRINIERLLGSRAVLTLQSFFRGIVGRCKAMVVAQETYEKFLDFDSGRDFWFNKRSATSIWAKPRALAWADVGSATRLPNADLLFEIRCLKCYNSTIAKYCINCDDLYCEDCYVKHSEQNEYVHVSIDSCVQCRFQIGKLQFRTVSC